MGVVAYIIPKTTSWLFVRNYCLYYCVLLCINTCKFFTQEDIISLRALSSKFGPLSKIMNKMLDLVRKNRIQIKARLYFFNFLLFIDIS